MQADPRDDQEIDGDSSDVVTGPVGSAELVEPTTADALSADLDRLTPIDTNEPTVPEHHA